MYVATELSFPFTKATSRFPSRLKSAATTAHGPLPAGMVNRWKEILGGKVAISRRKQQHHPGDGFNRSDHRTLLDFDSLPFVELLRRVRSKPVLFGASAENRRLYLGNRNSEWKHALGRYFRYSDTWQLVINTATTIITFLMVFLIQNTQNRDARAIHLKLDELIRCIDLAHDDMINVEKLSDEELAALSKKFDKVRNEFEDRKQRKGGATQNGRSSMKRCHDHIEANRSGSFLKRSFYESATGMIVNALLESRCHECLLHGEVIKIQQNISHTSRRY